MRASLIVASLLGAALLGGPQLAAAEDNQAGVPLSPAEAAGAWTVESAGRNLCVLKLTATKTAGGYAAQVPATCAEFIPGSPAAWQPTADGMRFVDGAGQPVIAFNRWSNSLFVSHRASGVDVQLKRGPPGA